MLRHTPDPQAWTPEAPDAGPCHEGEAAGPGPRASGPLVSVVMANHNGARFIEAALASVLGQGLRALEVLVADDASTDDSAARVAAIAGRDPRVRLLPATANAGPAAARNRALELARGRWIAIVDSDDLLHPDRLQRLLDAAEADRADIAADNMLVFDDAGVTPPSALLQGAMGREPHWVQAAEYARCNALAGRGPALGYLKPLLRAETLHRLALRYDPDLRIAEDYDLVMRLLAAGARMRTYPQLTYFYRKHGASISHRLSRATLLPMLAADDRFRATLAASTDATLADALDARRASILDALGFDTVVRALKQRRWHEAADAVLARPRVLPLLRVPLRDRLRRALAARLRTPAQDRAGTRAGTGPRICVLSRQRVVGAVNGSSAYLLGLCGALRDAGCEVDLVSPSPAVFGRWPALLLRPEMAVFGSIRVRGAWRVGSTFVSRDPAVAGAAILAVAARLLGRVGVRLHAARAPLAIAVPWTAADQLFVARHARGADLVLSDYAFLAPGAPYTLRPDVPLAIVMHDLFSAARTGNATPIIDQAAEMRLLATADAIIAIQAEEAAVVRRHLPDARLLVAPMAAQPVPAPQLGEDDRTVLFVASDTAPNREAMDWFLQQCWPTIRSDLPDAQLLVAGSVGNAATLRPDGVRFLGRVPSLDALYRQASVVISPLHSGSGLKIKLVEALAHGKAVVATTTTLQGVEEIAGAAVAWADAAPDFAAAVLQLLHERPRRDALCARALEVARRHFSPAACYGPLLDFVHSRCVPAGAQPILPPASAPLQPAASFLEPAATP